MVNKSGVWRHQQLKMHIALINRPVVFFIIIWYNINTAVLTKK